HEAVYVEHGAAGRPVRAPADQRRGDRPFAVAAEVDGVPFVGRAEQVRVHDSEVTAESHRLDTDRFGSRSFGAGQPRPQAPSLSTAAAVCPGGVLTRRATLCP